jgi:hypothetical protein
LAGRILITATAELLSRLANRYSSLRVWVLFLGAHVSRNGKEMPWFVAHLARGLRLVGPRGRDHLRDLLQRLFYLDRVLGQNLDEVWERGTPGGGFGL